MNDGITLNPASIAVVGVLLSALVGCIVFLFRLYQSGVAAQMTELREQRDSFKKVADRAVVTLEGEAERRQVARGEVPIPKILPVTAEHNSPTTERQRVAAEFETLNARQVAARLAIEGPVSAETPSGKEPEKVEVVRISPEAAAAIKEAARVEAEKKEGG
jgi:hypothetical protein